jgi:hypothetical protein
MIQPELILKSQYEYYDLDLWFQSSLRCSVSLSRNAPRHSEAHILVYASSPMEVGYLWMYLYRSTWVPRNSRTVVFSWPTGQQRVIAVAYSIVWKSVGEHQWMYTTLDTMCGLWKAQCTHSYVFGTYGVYRGQALVIQTQFNVMKLILAYGLVSPEYYRTLVVWEVVRLPVCKWHNPVKLITYTITKFVPKKGVMVGHKG